MITENPNTSIAEYDILSLDEFNTELDKMMNFYRGLGIAHE